LPAPVDLTAVTEVRNEIKAGTYIYDSAKVVDALQKAYQDMV
jgi:anti-sigma28 factor (negative regulator of flagellin synthesis)